MVHIPRIHFSSRRVLIMEYIDGAKINDLDYFKKHGIDKFQVLFIPFIYIDK